MFIPIYDINPLRTIKVPYVSYALIAATSLIFLVFQSGLVIDASLASSISFGVIPAELQEAQGLRDTYAVVPESLTFVTYLFVHGNWMHLLGNMVFLWVFGDNVEDAFGHLRFAIFYVMCGVGAALAHALATPMSDIPLVGASGSIAGIVAAYMMIFPKVKVWVLILMRLPLKISAMWAIGGWLVFQFAMAFFSTQHATAWWAHIGGFVVGVVLTLVMRRRGVPLFGRDVVVPEPHPLR